MGSDEIAAGSGAGVVGADGSVDVAGVEGDVGVLRRAGLAGSDRGHVEGERDQAGGSLGESGGGGEDADGKLDSE